MKRGTVKGVFSRHKTAIKHQDAKNPMQVHMFILHRVFMIMF